MPGGMNAGVGLVATEPVAEGQPINNQERSSTAGVIMRGSLRVEARDADGNVTGVHCKDDLTTKQLAQLIMLGILASNQSIKDTAAATNSETQAATTGTTPKVYAGTNATAATFADFALGTPTENVAATVGSISSNTFTVTGTVTAGSARAYAEVGIQVTVNSHNYLITHDVFSVLNVSSGGTLAVTYTFTFT